MLGRWKNYEDLEESLTLEELTLTVESIRDKEKRHNEFMAAINNIELEEPTANEDILNLSGYKAQKEGFGIGMGLGYESTGAE